MSHSDSTARPVPLNISAGGFLQYLMANYRQGGKTRKWAVVTLTGIRPAADKRTVRGLLDGSIEWSTDEADTHIVFTDPYGKGVDR